MGLQLDDGRSRRDDGVRFVLARLRRWCLRFAGAWYLVLSACTLHQSRRLEGTSTLRVRRHQRSQLLDVRGRSTAAAADDRCARFHEFRGIRRKFAWPDGEDSLAVHDLRHARVRLYDDRLSRDFRKALDERQHLVGAKPAVEAVGVDTERFEKRRNALDRRAGKELPRLVERN